MIGSRTKKGMALVAAGGALLWLAPLSASALGISITNVSSSSGNVAQLLNGDVLTFDLTLENASQLDIYGLSLGVTGYDVGNDGNVNNDNVRFVAGGAVAASAFNTTLLPGPIALGGLGNIRSAPTQVGAGAPFNNPRRVQLFDGVALTPSNGSGALDVGVGGGQVGLGDVHFRVSFRALTGLTSNNDVTFRFGVGEFGNAAVGADGVELAFNNASYVVNVIPEPGTALLLGFGLAGLAARGRR